MTIDNKERNSQIQSMSNWSKWTQTATLCVWITLTW